MDSHETNLGVSREELLSKLKSITFAAFMTALTTEMCIELVTMTPKGVCTRWIGYNDWNVFVLDSCFPEKWSEIRNKITSRYLLLEDLKGTQLYRLVHILKPETDDGTDCSTFLSGLLDLPVHITESYYCFCDEDAGELTFFTDIENLKGALQSSMSYIDSAWDDMTTGELEMWWDRYEEEGENLPFTYLDEE